VCLFALEVFGFVGYFWNQAYLFYSWIEKNDCCYFIVSLDMTISTDDTITLPVMSVSLRGERMSSDSAVA
jgi:hypothetical protein